MVGIHKQQPNDHVTHIGHTGHCPNSVDVEQVRLIGHVVSVAGEESLVGEGSLVAQDWLVQG